MHISHLTIGDCTPKAATPVVEIPATPSQIQILSQARLQVTSKKADAVSIKVNVIRNAVRQALAKLSSQAVQLECAR